MLVQAADPVSEPAAQLQGQVVVPVDDRHHVHLATLRRARAQQVRHEIQDAHRNREAPVGHLPCTARPGISSACPADTRPDKRGRSELRRWKPHKYSPVLAALLAGASAVAITPGGADAASGGPELKLTASDDTYVSSGRRSATFGAEDKLVIGVLDRDVKTSFVKFTVPAGAGRSGARLRLTTIGEPSGNVSVRRVLDNGWTEDKLTSGNAPALGPVLATVTPKPSDTALDLDLGAVVTGPGTYSFALTSTGAVDAVPLVREHVGRPRAGPGRRRRGPGDQHPDRPADQPAEHAQRRGPKPDKSGKFHAGHLGGLRHRRPARPVLRRAVGRAPPAASPPRRATRRCLTWEKISGRTATIFHAYHKGDEPFPTKAEIAMTARSGPPARAAAELEDRVRLELGQGRPR